MNLYTELLAVSAKLTKANIAHAICGGLAVAIHGAPRMTTDLDILVKPDDLDAATGALDEVGFRFPTGPLTFNHGTPQQSKLLRLNRMEGSDYLTLDLLLAEGFLEPIFNDRQCFELDSVKLPVVSLSGLIEMKRSADRPQDRVDIVNLEEVNREQ